MKQNKFTREKYDKEKKKLKAGLTTGPNEVTTGI